MPLYTRKTTVTAQQFLVEVTPWPTGVISVGNGYALSDPSIGMYAPISHGDYVVETLSGSKVVPKTNFEDEFVV